MHRSPTKDVILMIHGLCCGGEVWDAAATLFRQRGWRVETPTIHSQLRVKEHPDPSLARLSLADYVADMERAAERIHADTGRFPLVFGHSLGGLIAQKIAERNLARAAVLLTPSPPAPARPPPSTSTARRRPKPPLWTRITFANLLFKRDVLRLDVKTKPYKIWKTGFRWGMWHRIPRKQHAALYAATRYCSGLALRDALIPSADPQRTAFIDDSRIAIPILTIGAGKDRVLPIELQRAVASRYRHIGGDYLEYPDHSHWLLNEAGTEKWVDDVAAWLNSKVREEHAA
jgi:pimeloyl-ACP methyl ester carboxylesterase